MTVVPLHYGDRELEMPIRMTGDFSVENVEGLLRPENFDLWRDYISKKERDDLTSTKIGLIHRFFSQEHIGKPEADSQDKVWKAFILLRILRPTRLQYSNIQLKIETGTPDVFSVTHAGPLTPNAPYLQVFNRIHEKHLTELGELLPRFLNFTLSAPWYQTRAIRYFESGYSQISDPLLQFLTWTTAIESFLAEDRNPVPDRDLLTRINELVGLQNDIFSESEAELFSSPPSLTVADVLPDILVMRNNVSHGIRVPESFDGRSIISAATGETVHYADVLREATSFILRKLILSAVRGSNA